MRPVFLLLPMSLVASFAASEPVDRAGPPTQAIARAMQGRTAGTPVACISQHGLRNMRVHAGALLIEAPGGIVYVNEGVAGCSALALGRAIRTRSPSSRLCRGDIVTAFEPVSGVEFGGCALGEFVPYRRAPR